MPPAHLTDLAARSEEFLSTLRPVTLRPNRAGHAGYLHLILIEKGAASLSGQPDIPLSAHTALLLPPDPARILTLQAGSRGWLLGAAPDLVAEAVGQKSESLHLRGLTRRLGVVTCEANAFQTDLLTPVLAFDAEVKRPAKGSAMAAVAHLRLALIALWRHSGEDSSAKDPATQHGKSSEAGFVEDFRQLVELGFRSQRPVTAYAGELGLTYDRLHDICRRSLGRTPLQLIHQRTLREAALRLERSGETIEQVALALGFPDPTRFSHFFRRHAGLPPREFRAQSSPTAPTLEAPTFADWP